MQARAGAGLSVDPDLQRLSDCVDLQVADGFPDIRGWPAVAHDGARVGTVDDLIVSMSQMRACMLDVQTDSRSHTLVPVDVAAIDEERGIVVIDTRSTSEVAAQPRYLSPEATAPRERADRDTGTTDDREVRMPVMAEEAVVHKRVVPREMLVIKRRLVTRNETVETDLRSERVDVETDVDPARRTQQDRRL